VVSIGVLPTSTGSVVGYPVTIALSPGSTRLFAGSGASAVITLETVPSVLAVPTSAIHDTLGRTTVTVLRGGQPTTVTVTLGAQGPVLTQVLSGLQAGQRVVIADLSQPLPSSNSNATTRRLTTNGGGGPFGGGGGAGSTGTTRRTGG
jgi:HlyD family secretion protein